MTDKIKNLLVNLQYKKDFLVSSLFSYRVKKSYSVLDVVLNTMFYRRMHSKSIFLKATISCYVDLQRYERRMRKSGEVGVVDQSNGGREVSMR